MTERDQTTAVMESAQGRDSGTEQLQAELNELRVRVAELEGQAVRNRALHHELAEARLLAEAVQNASTDTLLVVDATGLVKSCNETGAARLNMTVNQVVGKNIFDLMPQEAVAGRRRWLQEAIETGKTVQFKDSLGASTFGHRLVPYFDPGTNAAHVVVLTRDISESEQAYRALRDSEARYRAILEDQTELICRYLPDGRLSYVNEAYARCFGKDRRELINTNYIPRIPDEDLALVKAHTASLNPDNPVTSFEHRVVLDNGDVVWQHWTHRAIFDFSGELSEYQAVGRMVTKRKLAQIALAESETRYRSLFEDSPISLWEEDFSQIRTFFDQLAQNGVSDFREHFEAHPEDVAHCADMVEVIDVNNATLRLCEAENKKDLLIGLDQVFTEKSLEVFKEELIALAGGETIFESEIVHASLKGNLRHAVLHLTVAPGYEQSLGKVLVSLQDISQRRLAETRLAEQVKFMRTLIDAVPSPIYYKDLNGSYQGCNRAYEDFVGMSEQKLVGKTAYDLFEPNEAEIIEMMDRTLVEHPGVQVFEQQVSTPEHGQRTLIFNKATYADLAGEVVGLVGIITDITDRKRAEEELFENQAFLHQIIETVPSLIFVKDRQERFVMVNKAMTDFYGKPPIEVLGRTSEEINPREDENLIATAEDQEVLESRKPLFIPQRVITDSRGNRRWFAMTKLLLPGKDQVLGVGEEITERMRVEMEREKMEKSFRQAQKMQALGTLAGGIAHDFNNMIFAILGFVRLASRQAPEGELKLREYLDQIQSAGMRASQLVRQILTFSRQAEQEKKPVQVAPLIKEVGKMLRATLPSNIEIKVSIENSGEKDWDTILGDPIQIHQVLMNLCTNAAHAMRDRGGVLGMSLARLTPGENPVSVDLDMQERDYIAIKVSDTGHGIDQSIIEQIYDPFFTTKKPGEGTGMGLSVVHGIVKSHGGACHVESKEGKGSVFSIILPRQKIRSEDEAGQCAIPPRGRKERILFVDDEALLVQMAEEMLSVLGYKVTAKASPDAALELFQKGPQDYDLVITDQNMPSMTGVELAKELLAIRCDIPIVLLTGYSETVSQEEAARVGIREFLMKPVIEEQIAVVIRRLLEERPRKES